ncbi:hypothetical protein P3S67_008908 [Capsicum chacoense]
MHQRQEHVLLRLHLLDSSRTSQVLEGQSQHFHLPQPSPTGQKASSTKSSVDDLSSIFGAAMSYGDLQEVEEDTRKKKS